MVRVSDASSAGLGRNERRVALLEKQRLLEEDLVEVKRRLNRETPVNELPEELLAEVFYHLGYHSAPVAEASDARDFSVVRTVCHQWDALISTTSRFWRAIRVRRSARWLTLCLSSSRNTPISLSFGSYGTLNYPSDDCLLSEVLIPHMPRVHFLQILHFDNKWAGLLNTLDQFMPALRELWLQQENDWENTTTPCVLRTTLPHLHSLSIVGPVDIQGIDQCRELRELTLERIPDTSAFIVLLAANRSLRNVTVIDCSRTKKFPSIAMSATHHGTVILPGLRKLHLETSSHALTTEILRRFCFPSATDVEITLKASGDSSVWEYGPQLLHAVLLPEAPSFDATFPMFGQTNNLDLTSDHEKTSLLATGPQHRITMNIRELHVGSSKLPFALSDIIRVLPGLPVSFLSINVAYEEDHASPAAALWEALFAAAPHLKTLIFWKSHGGCQYLYRGLLNASIAAANTGSLCCPSLSKLFVEDDLRLCPPYNLLGVLPTMVETLRYRNERGLRLDSLVFWLAGDRRGPDGLEVETEYRQVLGNFVDLLFFP